MHKFKYNIYILPIIQFEDSWSQNMAALSLVLFKYVLIVTSPLITSVLVDLFTPSRDFYITIYLGEYHTFQYSSYLKYAFKYHDGLYIFPITIKGGALCKS